MRETDREVAKTKGLNPLSVSTDRIALPAMRAMAQLHRHEVTDRSGDGRFFEVYPAGTLNRWGIKHTGYKASDQRAARIEIIRGLENIVLGLKIPQRCKDSDHALDALIASLTARAAALGQTETPTPKQANIARSEGWIHIPHCHFAGYTQPLFCGFGSPT